METGDETGLARGIFLGELEAAGGWRSGGDAKGQRDAESTQRCLTGLGKRGGGVSHWDLGGLPHPVGMSPGQSQAERKGGGK